MKGLPTGPAEPSCCVHGGRSWAGPRALHSPIVATPTARMAKIHLAQAALHRLGTDEAASKGEAWKKRGWREAEAAPAGGSMDVSVQWDLGWGGTKHPNTNTGVCLGLQRGLLTRHRLRVTPQNLNPENKKEFERFGAEHPLPTEPAEP